MKFAIALIAGIGLATAAAAEELPTCAVGMHLERAGGTNSPAVITEVDEAQGSYHIDYDNSTLEEWVTAQWLRYSCVGLPAGPRDIAFYAGAWDEVHQRGEPDLVINDDGSYGWLVDIDPAKIVRGTWRPAEKSELSSMAKGPGIVLLNALGGRDWYVESRADVDDDDREQILAQDDDSNYYYFFRTKG